MKLQFLARFASLRFRSSYGGLLRLEVDAQGDDVKVFCHLTGLAQFPGGRAVCPVEQGADPVYKTVDVDHRVPGKNVWKTPGEVAGQAATRAGREGQFEFEKVSTIRFEPEPDVIGAFVGISEKGLEKFVRPPFGEKLHQHLIGKQCPGIFRCHGRLNASATKFDFSPLLAAGKNQIIGAGSAQEAAPAF
jgi:hypothetical protein